MHVAESTQQPKDALAGTPYRTIGLLGKGGMGVVLEAEHRTLKKRVAIKLLRTREESPDLVARLRMEADVLATLESPHLVSVFDIGTTPAGDSYVVMERLVGRTIAGHVVAHGPVSEIEAIHIVRQALSGLAVAHAAGIVHRDIKPDNIFLCDGGAHGRIVKVLDFGVAKNVDVRTGELPGGALTAEGILVGSPRYISPEQVLGLRIDARTDIYAMGLVLFVLLTGRRPYHQITDFAQLCQAHAFEAPPSVEAHAQISSALAQVLERALAKDRNDRYQTSIAFDAALAAVAQRPVSQAPTVATPPAVHHAQPRQPRRVSHLGESLRLALGLVFGFVVFGGFAALALWWGGYL